MSVIQVPRTVGTATFSCSCCGKAHVDGIVLDKGNGPYAICCVNGRNTAVGDATITPIDPSGEITDWVPQGTLIAALANNASILGGQRLTIKRLEKRIAALMGPTNAMGEETAEIPAELQESIGDLDRADAEGGCVSEQTR